MHKIVGKMGFSKFILLAGTSVLLSACASSAANNDPYEGFNRVVFSFNEKVDDNVLHPFLRGYRAVVPSPVRKGLKNFLYNLKAPVRFANQLLQGDLEGAGDEFVRTSVNTFVGVGGLIDVAGMEGYETEYEDFGQTLGVWGVDHGPYMVVPLIGPSSMRDYAGYFVDGYFDPVRLYLHNIDKDDVSYTLAGLGYMNLRDDLMDVLVELEKSSIDYYAAVRSSYFQKRDALTEDRTEEEMSDAAPEIPDYGDEDFDF